MGDLKFAHEAASDVLKRGVMAVDSPSLMGVGRDSGVRYHEQWLEGRSAAAAGPPLLCHPTNGALLVRTTRGGEVTYHGPGQLTGYPILPLSSAPFKKDLHWYLNKVEEVVIRTLSRFGLSGVRDPRGTGVWVSGRKVAQVGIGCR